MIAAGVAHRRKIYSHSTMYLYWIDLYMVMHKNMHHGPWITPFGVSCSASPNLYVLKRSKF